MSSHRRKTVSRRLAPFVVPAVLVPGLAIPLLLGSSCLPDNPDPRRTIAAEGSNILLRVMSTEDVPIPLARVTVDGQVALTDAAGFVQFDDLPVGRFHARIDADGFTSAAVVTTIAFEASPYVEAHLFAYQVDESFDAGAPATIQGDGMRVSLPPNALVDSMGQPVTGMVDVGAVYLDPTDPSAFEHLPSHLVASQGGEEVILRSLMMTEVGFWQDGAPLQIAPGELARVELEFPPSVASSVAVGDQISAWSLDLDTGSWVEEGSGTVELNEAGDAIWVVYVSHFSWLNCDLAITTSNLRCFAVSVEDPSGALIPNLHITVTDEQPGTFKDGGISYTVSENQGGNCVVAEMGTRQPTLNIGETGNLLATANILDLLEQSEGPSTTLGGEPGVCFTNGLEAAAGTGDDRMPTALNAACTQVHVTLEESFTQVCTPGEVEICDDYPTEYADRINTGICVPSKQYCINGGLTLTECEGQVLPQPAEDCRTLADDDCDGLVDDYMSSENCRCTSTMDDIECYLGPPHTRDQGICTPGRSACDGNGTFGMCEGGQLPTTEDCLTIATSDGADDENCDGEPKCTGRLRSSEDTSVVLVDAVSDTRGNIYAVGYIDKGAVFTLDHHDGVMPEPAAEKSTFVVKFEANDYAASFDEPPEVAWIRVLPDANTQSPKPTSGAAVAIHEDPSGVAAIYILGSFQGRLDAVHGNDGGGADIFAARLNSAGQTEWITSFGGDAPQDAVPTDAALTADGSTLYLSGRVYGEFPDFPSGASGSIEGAPDDEDADAFILALRSDGTTQWARTHGSDRYESANAIAIDTSGNVLVAGDTTESFDAGNDLALDTTGGDPYLAKFTPEGDAVWLRSLPTGGGDLRGMVLDSNDVAFMTGTFEDEQTANDVYVARYASDGTQDFLWSWPNAGTERGEAIAIDSRDNLILTGVFTTETLEVGGAVATGIPGSVNVMLAKLEGGDGSPFWLQPSAASAHLLPRSVRAVVASRAYGDIYVMGSGWLAEFAP